MKVRKLVPIKGKTAFSKVFEKGYKFSEDCAQARILFRANCENAALLPLNYAVIASRRMSRKAVIRNRLKRLMRESLRKLQIESEAGNYPLNSWIEFIVLLWHKSPESSGMIGLADVLPRFAKIVARARENHFGRILQQENV